MERFRLSRFISGEKSVDTAVTLNHRRIFILPTLRGLGFALLLIILLLIAFIYNNNLIYLLTFLLASIFFITIFHSYKSLSGLIVQKGRNKAVFAGEAAGFDIVIDNPSDMERHQLKVVLQENHSLTLAAQTSECMTLYSVTQKRGWYEVGTVTVSSTFPFGLFRAWSPIKFGLKVLVYPKPSLHSIPFPQAFPTQSQQGARHKDGDDFYGLQEYQAGDSIRHIHWKAYAKGLGVFSKQYSGEHPLEEIWLDYGQTPGHDVEERLSQLCRWVVDAEQAGVSYGFCLPGLKLAPGQGLAHYQACLEALAMF